MIQLAAQRHVSRVGQFTNVEASCLLRQHHAQKKQQAKEIKNLADQFLLSAETALRRSRLHRSLYTRPSVRKVAEARWVEVLAAMLVHAPMPMENCSGTNLEASSFWAPDVEPKHSTLAYVQHAVSSTASTTTSGILQNSRT